MVGAKFSECTHKQGPGPGKRNEFSNSSLDSYILGIALDSTFAGDVFGRELRELRGNSTDVNGTDIRILCPP